MQKLLSNAKLPSQLLTSVEEVVSFTNTGAIPDSSSYYFTKLRSLLVFWLKTQELFFDDLKPRKLVGFFTLTLESY